jgi:hypothetical protein
MKRQTTAVLGVIILALLLSGFSCNQTTSTKRLAVASDAISHALLDAQQAIQQGTASGVISAQEAATFQAYLVTVSKAGIELDQSIRAGETATNVSQKVNVFLDAFNKLQTDGLVGIKNPQLKVAVSTAITGAESAVAIIVATVGGTK